jgi:hypothetical protein
MNLTAARLRYELSYDSATGIFTWNVSNSPRIKVGQVAGCARPNGYVTIHCCGRLWRAHRLAWMHVYGWMPAKKLDHIDGNKANNAIANLRLATDAQNAWNSRMQHDNASGLKGIYFAPHVSMYRARIKVQGKTFCLGYYKTKEEAHAAYCKAAREHHGEFWRAS